MARSKLTIGVVAGVILVLVVVGVVIALGSNNNAKSGDLTTDVAIVIDNYPTQIDYYCDQVQITATVQNIGDAVLSAADITSGKYAFTVNVGTTRLGITGEELEMSDFGAIAPGEQASITFSLGGVGHDYVDNSFLVTTDENKTVKAHVAFYKVLSDTEYLPVAQSDEFGVMVNVYSSEPDGFGSYMVKDCP